MCNNNKKKCDMGYYITIGIVVIFCALILVVGFLVISSKAAALMEYRKFVNDQKYDIVKAAMTVSEYIDFDNRVTSVDEETVKSILNTEKEESSDVSADANTNVPEYVEYTVEYGDSYWAIASEFYGDGSKYTVVMNDNGSKPLHPGDVVRVYTSNEPVALTTPKKVVATTTTTTSNTYSSDGTKPDWTTYKNTTQYDTSNMTYVGNWKVTGYDPHCAHCCSKTDGITASGNQAVLGYSVGTNTLPLGTIVYVEGYGIFRVDDRGSGVTEVIDIACDSHKICYQMTGRANVYIVNQ